MIATMDIVSMITYATIAASHVEVPRMIEGISNVSWVFIRPTGNHTLRT